MRFEGEGAWKRAFFTGELVVVRLSAVYFALVALPSLSFVQGPPSIDNSFVNVYNGSARPLWPELSKLQITFV